jgi:hypothetical protein
VLAGLGVSFQPDVAWEKVEGWVGVLELDWVGGWGLSTQSVLPERVLVVAANRQTVDEND